MGRKKTTGLFKKRGIWQIDKQILGRRIRMSTGIEDLREAELILAKYVDDLRQTVLFGTRPKRTFREAAVRYLKEKCKASLREDQRWISVLNPFIGELPLESVHMGSLQSYIDKRRKDGVKNRTINGPLQLVRHILNLASSEWLDDQGLTWLANAPKIRLLKEDDKREPYPLSWEEQDRLFAELPTHLREMALFKVNTGCREQEICRLHWEWEHPIPELNTSVFIIPKHYVKNREHRLIVLNETAKAVVDRMRGIHDEFVFTCEFRGKRKPMTSMNSTAWKKARARVGLLQVRVHDLKHTFGRRLRAAGVGLEDRQDLLGHKSGRITTHYSAVEIRQLIEAANRVCERKASTPTLTILKCQEKIPTISPPGNVGKLKLVK